MPNRLTLEATLDLLGLALHASEVPRGSFRKTQL